MRTELFDLHNLAREEGARFPRRRFLYPTIRENPGRHFLCVLGPRGVGKTILLRQLLHDLDHAFYISADTLVDDEDLFAIARDLSEKHGVRHLLLDEIHFQPDYPEKLKKIYDFLSLRIIFTSSVALSLAEATHDLSRRVMSFTLFPFSFREFLAFRQGVDYAPLELSALRDGTWDRQYLAHGRLFDEYLQGGLFPFALESPPVLPLIRNMLEKIIQRDLPATARLHTEELRTISKLTAFIGKSPVDGVNYTSLGKNLGITAYSAEKYVALLTRSFVLNSTFPRGTNVLQEPKILMYLPYRLLYRDYEDSVGGLREDFFAETMRMLGREFHYLKSTRGAKTPDFLVRAGNRHLVFEIGGRSKGRSQFKGIRYHEKYVLSHGPELREGQLPLFLLGFLP